MNRIGFRGTLFSNKHCAFWRRSRRTFPPKGVHGQFVDLSDRVSYNFMVHRHLSLYPYIYYMCIYIYIYGATRELPNFQGDPKIECPCKLMGIRSRPLLNSIVSRSQLWDREVNLIICSMSGVINPLIGICIQGLCRILTIGWMSIDHIYICLHTML